MVLRSSSSSWMTNVLRPLRPPAPPAELFNMPAHRDSQPNSQPARGTSVRCLLVARGGSVQQAAKVCNPHWHGAFPCRAHDVRFVNSTNTLSRFLFCLAEVRKCWAPTDSAYLHIHIHNPHVSTTQHTAVPTLSQAPRTSQLLRGRRCAASPNHTCCQR